MKIKLLLFFLLIQISVTTIFAQTPDANGVLYVKKGSAGNGSTWNNALGELANALKAASEASPGTVKQIWVAGGTYYPLFAADFASADNRDKAFVLVKDVKVYGGFAGTETVLADRNLGLAVNKTILTGDLGIVNDYTDNAYHVVVASGNMGTALIDGFTIMKGCSITGNETNALSVNGNSVMRIAGGGIIFHGASPAVNNVIISGNKAIAGAGLYIGYSSNPVFTNILINGNHADISGTGNGGAMFCYASNPVLINATIASNNAAGWGGAFVLSSSTPSFYNSIIYGNGTTQPVWVISGSTNMQYSMLQGGAANTTNHNLADTDPQFVVAPSYTTAPFVGGDFSLQATSPVINMGSNGLYAGLVAGSKDLMGNARVFNYAAGGIIDMGAIEAWDANVLPVKLVSFTAEIEGTDVKLKWQTSIESNSRQFVVYRSGDDQVFRELTRLDAAGSSATLKNYSYTDRAPLNGNNYYKLLQVDADGKKAELGIKGLAYDLVVGGIRTYPNPTTDKVSLFFESGKYTSLMVNDLQGRVLKTILLQPSATEVTVGLEAYPNGIYLFRWVGAAGSVTRKVVKQ